MISVVITTCRRRAFLREAVLSVINQDYRDIEVIVVDDGSTDSSWEEVRDLPVRYLWKENGGISSARNRGIGVSQGEYVAFLDVDDLWMKGKLSVQIRLMEEQGFSVSYTDEIWVRNGRRVNQKMRHKKFSGFIFERCLPLCIISPSSVVIRREVFNEVGLFDEALPVCEDYDMWLRISPRFPVLFVEKPLIVKRGGHADQLSKRYEAMDRFRIESLMKILRSRTLSATDHRSAVEEMRKKCQIHADGAKKRGRLEEAQHYLSLPERIEGSLRDTEGAAKG
jgi:glycosyltransferase involved in cell wall biosynthesis